MKKLFVVLMLLAAISANAQWGSDVRLTNTESWVYTDHNNIASSGDTVHIVWTDTRDGNYEIYYKRSTDGGLNWSTDFRLTNNTAYSKYPSIAVSGKYVHVVYQDNRTGNLEIYYRRSTNGGASWEADRQMTNDTNISTLPCISASGQVLLVVWEEHRDGHPEIYYKRSATGGASWTADTRLTYGTAYSTQPSISISGSIVVVVWDDGRDGNTEIYFKRSPDAGLSWGADIRLTYNPTVIRTEPYISISGTVVHIVWSDLNVGREIYYKRSPDSGISWGADIQLTNSSGDLYYPYVSALDQNVHIVWSDVGAIYYKRSTNGGVSWGTDTRLTNGSGFSIYPRISVSGTFVHVVWSDQRDGVNLLSEIYYKRNPTGNPIGIINISSEIPSAFSLNQNYPNPFNPTTVIRFSLSGVSNASLKVYDVMGREVETLVNEKLQPGTYETSFQGSQLTSGVYFYKLTTSKFTDVKKMILLK